MYTQFEVDKVASIDEALSSPSFGEWIAVMRDE